MKDVAIFIPTRNVGNALAVTLDRIPNDVKTQVGEIFVIDNDSEDDTYRIGVEYKKKNQLPNLNVYKNDKNLGMGGSEKKAFEYVINKNLKFIISLHGDAQYAPESIKDILKPLQKGEADFVFGTRMLGNPLKGGMPFWRFFGNKVLTRIGNLILGLNLTELHSGFRAFNVETLKKIPFKALSNDYHFDHEMIILFALSKKKIVEIPIPTRYAEESTSPSVSQTIKYSSDVIYDLIKVVLHKCGITKQKKFLLN